LNSLSLLTNAPNPSLLVGCGLSKLSFKLCRSCCQSCILFRHSCILLHQSSILFRQSSILFRQSYILLPQCWAVLAHNLLGLVKWWRDKHPKSLASSWWVFTYEIYPSGLNHVQKMEPRLSIQFLHSETELWQCPACCPIIGENVQIIIKPLGEFVLPNN